MEALHVNLLDDVRWTNDEDHTEKSEEWLASVLPVRRQLILFRRLFGMILPPPFKRTPTAEQMLEIQAAAALLDQAEALAKDGRARARRKNAAMDIEDAAKRLAAIPAPPEEGEDPHASDRATAAAAHAALLAAATPQVKDLLAQRAAQRAVLAPAADESTITEED